MIGQSRQLIESIFRPAKFERDVAALHMAGFIQALTERAYTVLVFVRRSAIKESYPRASSMPHAPRAATLPRRRGAK